MVDHFMTHLYIRPQYDQDKLSDFQGKVQGVPSDMADQNE